MRDSSPDDAPVAPGGIVAARSGSPHHPPAPVPTAAGQAALDAAQAPGRKAAAPATLRAYKVDWTHYAAWCAMHGFVPVPAAPATVGAYLASLKDSHAPTTVRRRLSAIGKMHRFNDLPWHGSNRAVSAERIGGDADDAALAELVGLALAAGKAVRGAVDGQTRHMDQGDAVGQQQSLQRSRWGHPRRGRPAPARAERAARPKARQGRPGCCARPG